MLYSSLRDAPETPVGWLTRPLRDVIGEIGDGGTPSRSNPANFGGDIAWAVISDIQPEMLTTAEYLTPQGLASSNAKIWPPGSVIVSTGATIGEVGIARVNLATKQGITGIVARPSETVPEFLAVMVRGGKHMLVRFAQGSTFREIRPPTFLRLVGSFPPLSEQRQIAEILDTVDEAVRSAEKLIAKLQHMKLGLLRDLLTRGIDASGELRDHDRHPELFTMSRLGPIPAHWNTTAMENVTDSGAPICYGIVQAGRFVSGGPQVVTIGDLAGDFRTGLHRTAPQIEASYARSRVKPGDVLLSIKGTIGRVAVVPAWFEGNISRDLARLRPRRSVAPEFIRQYMVSAQGQNQLQRSVVGTTRSEISIHVLKRLSMPLPPFEEQREIARRLGEAESCITAEDALLVKLRLLRSGLQEDLLTARVRVIKLLEGDAA